MTQLRNTSAAEYESARAIAQLVTAFLNTRDGLGDGTWVVETDELDWQVFITNKRNESLDVAWVHKQGQEPTKLCISADTSDLSLPMGESTNFATTFTISSGHERIVNAVIGKVLPPFREAIARSLAGLEQRRARNDWDDETRARLRTILGGENRSRVPITYYYTANEEDAVTGHRLNVSASVTTVLHDGGALRQYVTINANLIPPELAVEVLALLTRRAKAQDDETAREIIRKL